MLDRGELGHVRVGQRRVRIRQSQLDAFLAAGETAPEPERSDDEGDDWRPVRSALKMAVAAVDEQDRAALETAITGLVTAAQSLGSA
jgi:hypothetical protein